MPASSRLRAAALALALGVHGAAGHNSLVIPAPRNAVDGSVPAMRGGGTVPGGLTCTCASDRDCSMGDAREVGGAGQPCLWWSQGCSIGCPYCQTDPAHPDNGGKIPTKEISGNPPHVDKAGFRKAYCDKPAAAVLPKQYWTLNIHAQPGAEDDSYRFNPWRAPGSAPVVDPCGQAGGKYRITPMGGASVFGTVNVTTPDGGTLTLQMGDMGSKVLPATPDSQVTQWKAGSTPRLAWGMRFNHGGGYQYRLCPLDKMPCSEQDFQQMPLDFVRDAHAIMWNNGTLRPIQGMFVDDTVCEVVPKGSTWARNPIPRIHTDNEGMAFVGKCTLDCHQEGAPWCWAKEDCQQFPNPCPDIDDGWYMGNTTHMPTVPSFPPDSNRHEGWCSGDWTLGMVSDKVVIPSDVKPGRYVLSWRMDCEETAQIWQNCADINIVA